MTFPILVPDEQSMSLVNGEKNIRALSLMREQRWFFPPLSQEPRRLFEKQEGEEKKPATCLPRHQVKIPEWRRRTG